MPGLSSRYSVHGRFAIGALLKALGVRLTGSFAKRFLISFDFGLRWYLVLSDRS